MEAEAQEFFRCGDCNKAYAKRVDYNRHRKRHDKPHSCSFCGKRFGLKTDLGRHRQLHLLSRSTFQCKLEGCNFLGTGRKDYLWKHLQKKHKNDLNISSDQTLRSYYEDFAREGETIQNERDLELLEAASTGNTEKASDLLSKKVNISVRDSDNRTALHLASLGNHGAVVKLLCDYGANINAMESGHNTALHLATLCKHGDIVKLLCDLGADINGMNFRHYTALHFAAKSNYEGVMRILIESGADIERQGDTGTALYHAVSSGQDIAVRLLLENGADVNSRNNLSTNRTPLHLAALGSEGIVKLLLVANANIDARDKTGHTPLSYAIGIAKKFPWEVSRGFNKATTKQLLEAGTTVEQHHWDAMPDWFQEQNAKYNPTPTSPYTFHIAPDLTTPQQQYDPTRPLPSGNFQAWQMGWKM